ncbi:MAG TPA: asparaginase [Gemmatimonadales bacterium]|nr:asparaginase [Gemmatimonadales bacterium]
MIHLLFTGGTISMQRDPVAGGNVPTHGGEALVAFAGGLDRISPYRIENWAKLPACHLGPDRLWALRERVRQIAESGEVQGIVVAHGTDTLEETAYLLDRTLERTVPVAITGAMRTSSDDGWDGPQNLLDAATVAAADESAGRGVMVVFNGKVFAGRSAVKTHTTDLDAFTAPHGGELGRVEHGRVVYGGQRGSGEVGKSDGWAAGQRGRLNPSGLSARIALVPMVVGDDGGMLDLARPSHDGVVVVAFGSGNIPPGAVPAMARWIGDGKPVVLGTRCPTGVVSPLYAFEGGGARLVAMGAIPAGPRALSQARMELMISLSAGAVYGG